MRKAITIVLTVIALAVPSVNAWAAAIAQKTTPKKKVVTATRAFTGARGLGGPVGQRAGEDRREENHDDGAQDEARTVARKIIAVTVPVSPNHTDRSVFINQQALPILIHETLQSQSTGINMVSGATDSSYAFQSSLQSAILAAKAW